MRDHELGGRWAQGRRLSGDPCPTLADTLGNGSLKPQLARAVAACAFPHEWDLARRAGVRRRFPDPGGGGCRARGAGELQELLEMVTHHRVQHAGGGVARAVGRR